LLERNVALADDLRSDAFLSHVLSELGRFDPAIA